MTRPSRFAVVIAFVLCGCAGPAKLAERSQSQLAEGDHWKAWRTATRALEKAPANTAARDAAQAAAASICDDWQRRIKALAAEDSLRAATDVLALADFRADAARWVTLTPAPDWARQELALRTSAARLHYERAVAASAARRPKRAWWEWRESERFVAPWRDAAARAERARAQALTDLVVVPFTAADAQFGRDVAAAWRDAFAQRLTPEHTPFTRVMGADAAERGLRVSQLGRLTRGEAARLARENGGERVVWAALGAPESETELQVYREHVARRIRQKDASGRMVTHWVEVPIEVVARVRTVRIGADCEILRARDAGVLAHRRLDLVQKARVVWTSYVPEGDLDAYALVSDDLRTRDPARAKRLETRWKEVCGERATLQEVLEARRRTRGEGAYERGALGRLAAGAAFVFLSELPPAEDLALAALSDGWKSVLEELTRLDAVDDVDLASPLVEERRR